MKDLLNKVKEFHTAFRLPVEYSPTIPNGDTVRLRYELAKEELQEFMDACQTENHVKVFDALVDQLYILLGTAHVFGMADALVEGFNEVHKSNMTKLGEDGNPIYREDGKVLKSPSYKGPDLHTVLTDIYSK
jgi:predicted HAD superfamily Cof-like phosphohydrolase